MAFDPGAFDPGGYWTGGLPPPTPAVVVITVAGVDVSNDVVFNTASFEQKVNGNAGESFMRVRGNHTFAIGDDWLVEIDGEAAWRGFVLQVSDTYMFDAMDVDSPGFSKVTDLHGADQNILFEKRICYDGTANVTGTQFPPGTPDTTAITELLDNWLDLSGDDLDTTSAVDNVGDLDPEQYTRAWSGSWTWGQAMGTIAMLPAAIWYIRPENSGGVKGTLVYCDVDVPDAPFGLSDQPNGTTTRGYREMEIVEDGTSLATDVLAWGMGYGSQTPVFDREQDNIDLYGTWQYGQTTYGVFKQGTIDRIADSILNGSPSSKRGSKDPKPYVKLTTYQRGLLAGHKVEFTSNIWGWTDVIPVRQLTLTFESPENPKYELILSHEIDAPWSWIDPYPYPGIFLPPTPCPNPPCIPFLPGNPVQPTVTGSDCDEVPGTSNVLWQDGGLWDYDGATWSQTTVGSSSPPHSFFDTGSARSFGTWGLYNNARRHAVTVYIADLIVTGLVEPGDIYTDIPYQIIYSPNQYNDSTQPPSLTPTGTVVFTGSTGVVDTPVSFSFDVVLDHGGYGPSVGVFSLYAVATSLPAGGFIRGSTGAGTTITYDWIDEYAPYPGFVMDETPDYYWRFIQPSGTLTDETGHQNASISGSITQGATPGPLVPDDGAIYKNGSGYVYVTGGITVPFGNGPYTYMMWINPDSVSGTQVLMSASANQGAELCLNNNHLQIKSANTTDFPVGATAISAGVWTHVAWTYDGSNGNWRYFVNGVAEADKTNALNFNPPNADFLFGRGTFGGDVYSGYLAEAAIWNRALTDVEIAQIYTGRSCTSGTVVVGTSPPQAPNAFGCEEPERLSTTVVQTLAPFIPKSTFVWVDGLLVKRGTDYTEDPTDHTLTFASPVSPSVDITVCYFGGERA